MRYQATPRPVADDSRRLTSGLARAWCKGLHASLPSWRSRVRFPSPALHLEAELLLGEQRAERASSSSRAPTMAVGADDVALLHLSQDCIPAVAGKLRPNCERLVAEMIELKHD